jgi:hypothetical protein
VRERKTVREKESIKRYRVRKRDGICKRGETKKEKNGGSGRQIVRERERKRENEMK